jgi:PhnB protein
LKLAVQWNSSQYNEENSEFKKLNKNKIMALINPHINFNGNAEEAFTFYKSVFGGEFAMIMRFKDMASPEFPVADHEANKIMHIALPIGQNVLMANDVPESMGRTNENENRSKIAISAESREEADKLFSGLSAGGKLKCLWKTVLGVPILGCLEINTA